MDNPFKEIGLPHREPPKELKKKIMADLSSIKLLIDMTDLFSMKYVETAESFLKIK
jgi:hypothetical protein